MRVWPQTKSFGSYSARLPGIQVHNVHSRGVTGFVAANQHALGIGKELSRVRNDIAGGKGALLSHPGGEQCEIWRRHIVPQNKSPLAIGRKGKR